MSIKLFSTIYNCHYEKIGNEIRNIEEEVSDFDIPDTWRLCRFSVIANIYTGNSINENEKQRKYTGLSNGYNYIGTKDVSFDHSINYQNGIKIPYDTNGFKIAYKDTPLMCIEGGSAGRKIGILSEDVCFGNKLCAFQPLGVDPKYLYYYLQNPIFTAIFKANTTGIIGGVSVNTLKTLIFALPPFAEQKRIVNEIERFEPLIAEYERLEQQATKLDGEIYDNLKKSILQYAIQGKLVPQDSNDEPASVLLEKIRAEKKAKLGKKYVESYIYKGDDNCYYEKVGKSEPVKLEDLPFDIPDSWTWSRLKDIVEINPRNIEQAEIDKIKSFLIEKIKQCPNAKFYLGGYGCFDHLVFSILRKLKKDFPNIELVFISPYLDSSYSKLQIANEIYDGTLYPPLETVPKKFAILKRNEWMVDNCDLLVAYVRYSWGGARKTLDYAIRKKKPYINFVE